MLGSIPYEILEEIFINLETAKVIEFQRLSKYIKPIAEKHAYRVDFWNGDWLSYGKFTVTDEGYKNIIQNKMHLFRRFSFRSNEQILFLKVPNLKQLRYTIESVDVTAIEKLRKLSKSLKSIFLVFNSVYIGNYNYILMTALPNLTDLSVVGSGEFILFEDTYSYRLTKLVLSIDWASLEQVEVISNAFPNLKFLSLSTEFQHTFPESEIPTFPNLVHLELNVDYQFFDSILLSKKAFPSIKTLKFSERKFEPLQPFSIIGKFKDWPELKQIELFAVPKENVRSGHLKHIKDLTISTYPFQRYTSQDYEILFYQLTSFKALDGIQTEYFSKLNRTTNLRKLTLHELSDITLELIKWLFTCNPELQYLHLRILRPSKKSTGWYYKANTYKISLMYLITVNLYNPDRQFLRWFKGKVDPSVYFE